MAGVASGLMTPSSPTPNDVLIPGNCVRSHGKGKLRLQTDWDCCLADLEVANYPGLSRSNISQKPLSGRERQERGRRRCEKGSKVGMMWCEKSTWHYWFRRWRKGVVSGSWQKHRNRFSTKTSREEHSSADILILAHDICIRLPTSRTTG